jgi:flagellar hook-basal body complex protein FliE
MAIPVFTVRPSDAAQAYRSVDAGAFGIGAAAGTGFGEAMRQAIAGVIDTARDAEAQSMQAIAGNADITEVVTAVSKAELAMQTTMTIRDRVVQAYQDIMRMPI